MDYYSPLYPDSYYHIYNRGNNGENLFYKHKNYLYFLQQYNHYMSAYVDTFAYCLLPNHFHLLVRVKGVEEFPAHRDTIASSDGISSLPNADTFHLSDGIGRNLTSDKSDSIPPRDGIANPASIVSDQFRKLFIGYAQAINKQEARTGSLFQKNFKRIEVKNEPYFSQLIYYIHANPLRHGIFDDFRDYPYSSYNSLLSGKQTKLLRDEAIGWFGNKESFRDFHNQVRSDKAINSWLIEED